MVVVVGEGCADSEDGEEEPEGGIGFGTGG